MGRNGSQRNVQLIIKKIKSKIARKMNIKEKLRLSYNYIYLTSALILTFWLISIFEIFSKVFNKIELPNIALSLVYKLSNDFLTAILIGLLLFPLFLFLDLIKFKRSELVITVLFLLIIILQYVLVKTQLNYLVNLGADLLGYSINDIYITVTASESLSVLYFLPYILLPSLFLGIHYLIVKHIPEKTIFITTGIITVFFLVLKISITEVSSSIYSNKLSFFISDIIRFKNEKNDFNVEKIVFKNEYPLLKPFKNSPDVLAPFFQINQEKPNIVLNIV